MVNMFKTEHTKVHKKQYFHVDGIISLNIENVTTEDEGQYTCVQTTSLGREKFRTTYNLNTFREFSGYFYE